MRILLIAALLLTAECVTNDPAEVARRWHRNVEWSTYDLQRANSAGDTEKVDAILQRLDRDNDQFKVDIRRALGRSKQR